VDHKFAIPQELAKQLSRDRRTQVIDDNRIFTSHAHGQEPEFACARIERTTWLAAIIRLDVERQRDFIVPELCDGVGDRNRCGHG
jgi:hypothetical protein